MHIILSVYIAIAILKLTTNHDFWCRFKADIHSYIAIMTIDIVRIASNHENFILNL